MRILLLTQWYMPEPFLLLQELAQTLLSWGHEVEVLTGFPNYPYGKLYPGYKMRLRQREILNGVPVARVPLYPDHSRSGILRVINYLSFSLAASVFGPSMVDKPDVIFVYHPPLTIGIPAYLLSRLWQVPFVYQIQDMWPETLSATGMLNNPLLLQAVGVFAKWIYSKADALCVISSGFLKNLVKKGVSSYKVHLISNWIDQNAYYPAQPNDQLAQKLGLANKFNVLFAGNIGEAQGLETVLEAAEELQGMHDIQFVIVGDGVALPRLRRIAKARDLQNVRFLGRYPRESMPALYALADILLVHLKDDPLFRITIPHKIFSYMASGRPILAAVDGDAADVVIECGAGIACPPQNVHAMTSAVQELFAMPKVERQRMADNGLSAAHTKYSRVTIIKKIETLLQILVNR